MLHLTGKSAVAMKIRLEGFSCHLDRALMLYYALCATRGKPELEFSDPWRTGCMT